MGVNESCCELSAVKKRALFLDRDGIINKKPSEHDYIKNWKEFCLIPGVENLIILAKRNGFLVIVFTNQRGVARNLMSKNEIEGIHQKMCNELKKRGAVIDKVFCCIHDYKDNCNCRKPKPGLLFMAASEFNIDLSKSLVIGDSRVDILAGKAAGCTTMLVESDKEILPGKKKIFFQK